MDSCPVNSTSKQESADEGIAIKQAQERYGKPNASENHTQNTPQAGKHKHDREEDWEKRECQQEANTRRPALGGKQEWEADGAYRGQELAAWCSAEGDWDLEVVERTPGVRGFSVQPKRWVVERTFGWLSRNRRMSKDYERKVQTSETFIEVAMIRLLVARLVGRT
jgi:hypothetical protein